MKSKGYSEFGWPIKARCQLFRYILIVAIQKDSYMTKSPERKPLLAEQVTAKPMKIGCNVKFRRNLLDTKSKLYKNLKQIKATLVF